MERVRLKQTEPTPDTPFAFLPQKVAANCAALGWYAMDFAVALGLLAEARRRRGDDIHERALIAGASSIDSQRDEDRLFRAQWAEVKNARRRGEHLDAPERYHVYDTKVGHTDGLTTRTRLKKAGAYGYKKAKQRLRKSAPPERISIILTTNKLLELAGLSRCDKNRSAVKTILDHLQQEPFGLGLPPCILHVRQLDRKNFEVSVSGAWLEPPFVPILLPLPIRSLLAVRLWMLLRCIDTRERNRKAMPFDKLCERIGIDPSQSYSVKYRAVIRALDAVNAALEKIDTGALWHRKIDVAERYDMTVGVRDRMVRFVSKAKEDSVEHRVTIAEHDGDYITADRLTALSKAGLSRKQIKVFEALHDADPAKLSMLLNAPDEVIKRFVYMMKGNTRRERQEKQQEQSNARDRFN
jgi:hypothetical protein